MEGSSKATKSPKATKRPEVKRATQACTDNPDFRVNTKVKKSCEWISATSVRMENNCVKPKVLENCPVACGICPRNGPNDEPTMDEGSTGSAGANKNSKSSKKSKCSLVPFDLPNTTKLGAEVYKFEPRKNSKSSKAQKIADNGIEPDSINKYAWSSALDDEEDLYIGTFNINFNIAGVQSFENNLGRHGPTEILKLWSGSPLTYSEGGAIYKRKNDGKFKRVLKAGHDHVGFRKGINYDGDMYFGSANGKTGAKIFTNKDSEDNFKVLDDEFYLNPTDSSIRAMCTSSYSNRLFMGTENLFMGTENLDGECGPSILAYDGTKGIYERGRWSNWNRCTDINMGYGGSDLNSVKSRHGWYDQVPNLGFAVAECTELEKGKMLFGTWNGNGYKLVVYDEEFDIFSELATPSLMGHDTNGVMELRVFNGHLYVGLLSYRDGFALIRTSIDDTIWNDWVGWEEITLNGFAEEQVDELGFRKAINPYPWSSTVADGVYYIGTFAGLINEGADMFSEDANPVDIIDGRAQLWSSANGLDWTLEEHNGFDQEFTYGFRTMQATSDGSLYIGTASNLFLPDLTRAPYTDFLPDLTGDGNEDICLIVDEIESAFFTLS